MDRQSLYSSYRQYKADTDFVVTWLATSAAKCGYSMTNASGYTAILEAAKAGGKSHPYANNGSTTARRLTRTVEMKELVPMAHCIATSTKPSIDVPEVFAYLLKQAISERERHHKWHLTQHRSAVGSNDAKSDSTHEHFIATLKDVEEVLHSKLPSRVEFKAMGDSNDPAVSAEHVNMFNSLSHETLPEDTFEGGIQREHITAETTSYTIESDIDSKDLVTAAIYLLKDVHRIRALIKAIWHSYHNRKIDLVTASIATNTAIDFIRSIQEDLESTFTDPVDWHEYVCLYCVYLQDTGKVDSNARTGRGFCLTAARQSLRYVLNEHTNGSVDFVATVHPALVDLYKAPPTYSSLATEGETAEFGVKLAMSMLPEFFNLARWAGRWQAEHEILRGLREVWLAKKQIFWVTCAVQIYIDIRHILKEQVVYGFQDLLQGSSLISSRVEQVLKFHKLTKIGPTRDDEGLSCVLELVNRWTNGDYIDTVRKEHELDPAESQHLSDCYLLKRDPLWCGLLLYNFRMVEYEGALITLNSWTSVLAAAHLYNALRQTRTLTKPWPAMETVLCPQRIKELFLGNFPTKHEEFFRRFVAAIGLSSLGFARGSGRPMSVGKLVNPRKLSTKIPVSWIFKKRYCDSDLRVNLRPAELEEVLNQKLNIPADTRRRGALVQLDPLHLLMRLGVSIQQETEESTFDYFQLHRVCWKMLRDLKKNLQESEENDVTYVQSEREVPSVVGVILENSWEEQRLWAAVNPARKTRDAPCRILAQAAKVVENTIALM